MLLALHAAVTTCNKSNANLIAPITKVLKDGKCWLEDSSKATKMNAQENSLYFCST
jgi:hypothetical protein